MFVPTTFFLFLMSLSRNVMGLRCTGVCGSVYGRTARKSPITMRSSFLQDDCFPSKKKKLSELRSLAPVYKPRSENQQQYVDYLNNATIPIVFGIGPAGCGKTLFACTSAIHQLRSGTIKKIILTRPIVPVEEEEIGFLPGSLINKMDPWTRPIFDIFLEFYQQKDLDSMIHSGVIEISPLAYMRGRTFKGAYIIADEMQNSTPNQMLMLTTRIGPGSKMAITGDLKQSDRSVSNGLLDIMSKIREQTLADENFPIKMVEMNYGDIERSPIVATILKMYQKKVGIVKPKAIDMDAALIPLSHMEKGL
jgi:phosphate starvation-inducible protein PhoH and related proteins